MNCSASIYNQYTTTIPCLKAAHIEKNWFYSRKLWTMNWQPPGACTLPLHSFSLFLFCWFQACLLPKPCEQNVMTNQRHCVTLFLSPEELWFWKFLWKSRYTDKTWTNLTFNQLVPFPASSFFPTFKDLRLKGNN